MVDSDNCGNLPPLSLLVSSRFISKHLCYLLFSLQSEQQQSLQKCPRPKQKINQLHSRGRQGKKNTETQGFSNMKDEPGHLRFFCYQSVRLHNRAATWWRLGLGPGTTGSALSLAPPLLKTMRSDTNSQSNKCHFDLNQTSRSISSASPKNTHTSRPARSLDLTSPITHTPVIIGKTETVCVVIYILWKTSISHSARR